MEAHSALNGALLAFGLLPLAAEIVCLVVGVAARQPWFFVLMGGLFVLMLISGRSAVPELADRHPGR